MCMDRHDSRSSETAPARQVAAGLAKLALVSRHEAWQASGETGLTPTQAQILAVIAGASGPIGIGGVAEQLAITAGTASAAVSTLVERGLIAKRRAVDDGRAIRLHLTPKGRRRAARASAWPDSIFSAIAALPEEMQSGLLRGLIAMIRDLQERGAVPTARMCVGCRFFRPNSHPGTSKAHHCAYIDAPIGDRDLRIDCGEMEPVSTDRAATLWRLYIEGQPIESPSADEHDVGVCSD